VPRHPGPRPVYGRELLVRLRGKGRCHLAGLRPILAADPGESLHDCRRLGSSQSAVSEAVKTEPLASRPECVVPSTAPVIDKLACCRALQAHYPVDLRGGGPVQCSCDLNVGVPPDRPGVPHPVLSAPRPRRASPGCVRRRVRRSRASRRRDPPRAGGSQPFPRRRRIPGRAGTAAQARRSSPADCGQRGRRVPRTVARGLHPRRHRVRPGRTPHDTIDKTAESRLDLVRVLNREVLAEQADSLLDLLDDYRRGWSDDATSRAARRRAVETSLPALDWLWQAATRSLVWVTPGAMSDAWRT